MDGGTLTQLQSGEVVVARPYADGPFRVVAWVFAGALVGIVASAVYLFEAWSGPVRIALVVFALLLLLLTWAATRPRPNEWRFDDEGWSMVEPFDNRSGRVQWSEVVSVRFTFFDESRAILLDTREGSCGITLETVRCDKVVVFIEQLVAHLPSDRIDSKVLALAADPHGRALPV